MTYQYAFIEERLMALLEELEAQPELAASFPPEILGYAETMANIREWLDLAGEYGLACEVLVSLLESFDFKLAGKAAIKLLEVGLYFGFKFEGEASLPVV